MRGAFNDRTAWSLRSGQGTVYSPDKYRETEGIKDYSNVSGNSAKYDAYIVATGQRTQSGISVSSGTDMYNSNGTIRYHFTSAGGHSATQTTKHFLVRQGSAAAQNFAFDMEDY